MESNINTKQVIDYISTELETIQEVSEPNSSPNVSIGSSGDANSIVGYCQTPITTESQVQEPEQEIAVPYNQSLVPKLYTELSIMLQGTTFSEVNWVILLTKTMSIVSQVNGLNKKAKVALSVDLVIKYLDEKTKISDDTLIIIKDSVFQMCMNILDGQSILKGTRKESVNADPTMRTPPQQIANLLVTVIENSTQTWSLNTLVSQSTGIILTCITITNKFQHLTGIEKREVIINAINKIVESKFRPKLTPGSPEDVSVSILLTSLPVMIDTLVAVGKGKPAFKFDFQDPATQSCLLSIVSTLFKLCKK